MSQVIKAEMSASVWKVEVQRGEAVTAGQTLMILESMKMEIPVNAPSAGTVSEIHVVPEAVVQEGDPLATLD